MTDAASGCIFRTFAGNFRRIERDRFGPEVWNNSRCASLQEFRHVLDNARLTAWTVSELLSAVESQKDPAKVLSFVAAERLRRSNQLLKDLCRDIDDQGVTWQTHGIQSLYETVNILRCSSVSWWTNIADGSRRSEPTISS